MEDGEFLFDGESFSELDPDRMEELRRSFLQVEGEESHVVQEFETQGHLDDDLGDGGVGQLDFCDDNEESLTSHSATDVDETQGAHSTGQIEEQNDESRGHAAPARAAKAFASNELALTDRFASPTGERPYPIVAGGGALLTDAIFEAKPQVAAALNGLAVQNTYVKLQKMLLKIVQNVSERADAEISSLRKQVLMSEERAQSERHRHEDQLREIERRVLAVERDSLNRAFRTTREEGPERLLEVGSAPSQSIFAQFGTSGVKGFEPSGNRGGDPDSTDVSSKGGGSNAKSSPERAENGAFRTLASSRAKPRSTTPRRAAQGRSGKDSVDGAVETQKDRIFEPLLNDERPFSLGRFWVKDEFEKFLLKVLCSKNDTYLGRVFLLPVARARDGAPAGFLLNLRVLRVVAKLSYPETFLLFPRRGLCSVPVSSFRSILEEFGALQVPRSFVGELTESPFAVRESVESGVEENWLLLPKGFLEAAGALVNCPSPTSVSPEEVELEGQLFYGKKNAWPPKRSLDSSSLRIRMPREPDDPSPDENGEGPKFAAPLRADDSAAQRAFSDAQSVGADLVVIQTLGRKFNAAMGRPDLEEPAHWSSLVPVFGLPTLGGVEAVCLVGLNRLRTVAFAPIKKAAAKKPTQDSPPIVQNFSKQEESRKILAAPPTPKKSTVAVSTLAKLAEPSAASLARDDGPLRLSKRLGPETSNAKQPPPKKICPPPTATNAVDASKSIRPTQRSNGPTTGPRTAQLFLARRQ